MFLPNNSYVVCDSFSNAFEQKMQELENDVKKFSFFRSVFSIESMLEANIKREEMIKALIGK